MGRKTAVEEWILCLIECALLKKCSLLSILKRFSFPMSPTVPPWHPGPATPALRTIPPLLVCVRALS